MNKWYCVFCGTESIAKEINMFCDNEKIPVSLEKNSGGDYNVFILSNDDNINNYMRDISHIIDG